MVVFCSWFVNTARNRRGACKIRLAHRKKNEVEINMILIKYYIAVEIKVRNVLYPANKLTDLQLPPMK